MNAYVFPGQGSQFEGMGKELYDHSDLTKEMFKKANEILGFDIAEIMKTGSKEDLLQTKVTQPALFLHSVIRSAVTDNFHPDMVAGHSLGEFSALVAAQVIPFEEGLKLVSARASAMQSACEAIEGTMAAIVGLEDAIVENICSSIDEVVVAANYNCPGQLVISGSKKGVELGIEKAKEAGARMAVGLAVGGAFHSPLMKPAEEQLKVAIENTLFSNPTCPIYQNVDAKPNSDPSSIKVNLIKQLTAPVRWTQTIQNMISDGVSGFKEVGGNGKVLKGMILRVNRRIPIEAI